MYYTVNITTRVTDSSETAIENLSLVESLISDPRGTGPWSENRKVG